MNENTIAEFWQNHPCGEGLVGVLESDYQKFFDEYDAFRYGTEKHILACLDDIDWAGKKVLEVGLGQGADAEQIIRRGANWSGLDLTDEAVERTSARLSLRGFSHNGAYKGSILETPFADNEFDMVFSHGVLHHIPDIYSAQKEIRRVLKNDGELVIMVYAKWSLNYLLAISVIRRLGLIALVASGAKPHGLLGQHVNNAQSRGLFNYLKMNNFIHHNTDGPSNPYSKVYDRRVVAKDFPDFRVVRTYKRFMHAPPLPVQNFPGGNLLGWHLWAHLRPQ